MQEKADRNNTCTFFEESDNISKRFAKYHFIYCLADCDGVPNGDKVIDACGICGGDDTSCGMF